MKRFVFFCLLLCSATYGYSLGETEFTNGIEYYKQEKILLSIGSFKQAITKGYANADVYFYLGNAYLKNSDFDKAIEYYNTAFETALSFELQAKSAFNLGFVYYLNEDYTNSSKSFDMAYGLDESIVQSFWLKGMATYQMQDKDSTITAWENYIELAPEGQQSDEIREALKLLKAEDFDFPPLEGSDDALFAADDDEGTNNSNQTTGSQGSSESLIDISGVLDDLETEDQGLAEDLEFEDLEM